MFSVLLDQLVCIVYSKSGFNVQCLFEFNMVWQAWT